jgi:hypothetical protein
MRPAISLFIISASAIIIAVLVILLFRSDSRVTERKDQVDSLQLRIDSLQIACKKDTLKEKALPGLSPFFQNQYRKRGLENPTEAIRSSLRNNPGQIPYEGTLGGTMRFPTTDRIWVLTNQWVLAYFEDGHQAGYLLLRYKVTEKGTIRWDVIDS